MKNKLVVQDEQIAKNLNHFEPDSEVASTVDDAIKVLDSTNFNELDKHPEKRLKAAYASFEEHRLPQLKTAHPTFRLSQLKQLLRKEWLKSSENPLNQKILNIIE